MARTKVTDYNILAQIQGGESTLSGALELRTKDITKGNYVPEGGTVAINATDNTKLDIAAGTAYPFGKRINFTNVSLGPFPQGTVHVYLDSDGQFKYTTGTVPESRSIFATLTVDASGHITSMQDKRVTQLGGVVSNRGIAFTISDDPLAIKAKVAQVMMPVDAIIDSVDIYSDTAPVGADIIVDINKNGTTIFTTQANRPRVTAGSNAGTAVVPDVTQLSAGDRLSVDVEQVGTTTAGGNDLLVSVVFA